MIAPCPHCGKPVDLLQLVYASGGIREQERIKAQAEFDREIAEGKRNSNGIKADEYTKAKGE